MESPNQPNLFPTLDKPTAPALCFAWHLVSFRSTGTRTFWTKATKRRFSLPPLGRIDDKKYYKTIPRSASYPAISQIFSPFFPSNDIFWSRSAGSTVGLLFEGPTVLFSLASRCFEAAAARGETQMSTWKYGNDKPNKQWCMQWFNPSELVFDGFILILSYYLNYLVINIVKIIAIFP